MFRHQKYTLLLLVIGMILLGACDSAASLEKCSDCPESVQDGTVSAGYYEQISDFYRDSRPTIDSLADLIDEQLADKEIIYNEEYVINLTDVLQGFDEVLDTYDIPAKTKADEEIHFQLDKVIHFQRQLNEMEVIFIESKDTDLIMSLHSTLAIVKNIVEDLDDIVHDYELIEE